jgi:GNAT superfamily N-acetyltransferase
MADAAGKMVGYVRGWWEEESPSMHLFRHNGFLLPAWRRKGIGSTMLSWMENRLKDIAETHPRECNKYLQANVSQFQKGTSILLERAGYQPVRYFFSMVRPTLENIPDLPLPDGLEIRPATPNQYRAIWESIFDPDEEEWGSPEPTEAAYQEWLRDPHFQPHLWQIAWDKGTGNPVGHVLTFIDHDENKQSGRKRGYTEGIGVARAWRRRGVARALISRSLQAQKDAGMSESALAVDRDSTSNATSLYESCGFQVVKCDTIYRKPLSSEAQPSTSSTRPPSE